MKKIICIILSVATLSIGLVGCGNGSANESQADITRYTTEGKVTKMVPDETLSGELSVDLGIFNSFNTQELEQAEKLYKKLYPNMKLTIVEYDLNDKTFDHVAKIKKTQAEIMAGKGPDVFISNYSYSDYDKQMKSGVYADLTEYFENDKNFNVSDFAEDILYSGQYQGKQYLVPTGFQLQHLLTTQSIIDEVGFDIKKCKDFLSMEEELIRVLEENKLKCDPQFALCGFGMSYWFLNEIDTTWIDYENEKVNLVGNNNVKKAFENSKKFLKYNLLSHKSGKPYEAGHNLDVSYFEALSLKTAMFIVGSHDSIINRVQMYRDMKATGEELVVLPIKDFNGKNVAVIRGSLGVNANSKNIPAAYAFIKLLLSDEFLEIKQDENENYYYPGEENGNLPLNKKFFKEMALKQGSFGDRTFDAKMKIIPAYMMTEEDVDMLTDIYYCAEVGRINSGNIYSVMDEMDAFILKDGSYEKAIESAQNDAEIYVSE